MKRRDIVVSGSIVVAALLLRIVAAVQLASGAAAVYRPSQATDMATYWELSGKILSGGFSGEFYYQPFYYAVWLPALRFVWDSIDMVIAAQIATGTLTVLLVVLTGRLIGGRAVGWVSGALCAVCTPLLLYTPFLIIANIQALWMALIAWLGVRLLKNGGTWNYWLLSLTVGTAILTRGNAWYIFPVLVLLFLFRWSWRRAFFAAAGSLLVILIVQLPFIWHNTAVRGIPTGPSTAAGQVMALGNTPEAPPGGRDFNGMAGPMEYPDSWQRWMAEADSRPVVSQILAWAGREPLGFAELQFRKLLMFWDWRDIPNNVALFGEGASSYVVKLFFVPGIIIALALAEMLSGWRRAAARRRGDWFFLLLLICGYWFATAAFYNLSRFRAPLFPILSVFAGMFAVAAVRRFSLCRRGFYLTMAPALLTGVFFAFAGYDFYSENCENAVIRVARPSGVTDGNVIRDNGPFSFGGWSELKVKSGDRLVKRLAGCDGVGGVVTLNVVPNGGRRLPLSVALADGAVYSGVDKLTFPVADCGKIEIKVVANPGGSGLIVDLHRDYGRTEVNGRPSAGELVLSAALEK
ncbi:MAG: hypothetical protein PHI85_00270 [Victivallaceae bacterium]|nr:hypothetical protein [Victivallaceae bacterium]